MCAFFKLGILVGWGCCMQGLHPTKNQNKDTLLVMLVMVVMQISGAVDASDVNDAGHAGDG